MAMLESTGLLDQVYGLDAYTAKLLYCWSQMTVTDELRRRQRSVSLAFFDFIEGLARLADFISPPNAAQLQEFWDCTGPPSGTGSPIVEYYQRLSQDKRLLDKFGRRDSAGLWPTKHSRPLADKFGPFLELLMDGLMKAWGGATHFQAIKRMHIMAKMMSGGVELD